MRQFDLALTVSMTWLLVIGGDVNATVHIPNAIGSVTPQTTPKLQVKDRALASQEVTPPERSIADNSSTSNRVDLSPFFLENPFFLDNIGRRTATSQALAAGSLLAASLKLRARAKMPNSHL